MSRSLPAPSRPPLSAWVSAGALAAVASVAVNLAVFGVADAADASLVVVDGGDAHEVMAGDIAVASLVPLVVGVAVVAAVVAATHRRLGVVRLAQVVGGGFALLSVAGPLTIDTDGGTAAALATMHVVTGAAFVLALEAVRRRMTPARHPAESPDRSTEPGDAPPVAA